MTAENPARRIDLEQLSDECDKVLREQSPDSNLLAFAKQVCSGLLEEAVECGRDRERELEIERERERELQREKEREEEVERELERERERERERQRERQRVSLPIAMNGSHSPNQLQNASPFTISQAINGQHARSSSPKTPSAPSPSTSIPKRLLLPEPDQVELEIVAVDRANRSPIGAQQPHESDASLVERSEGQRKSTRDQSVSTISWDSTDTNELMSADLGVEFLSPKNKPVTVPVAVVHDSFKSTFVSFESFSSCIMPRSVESTHVQPSRDVITVNDGVLELDSTSSSSRLDADVEVEVDADVDINVQSPVVQASDEMERLFAVESTRFARLRSAIANVLAGEFDSARSLLSFGTDEVEIADAAIDIMLCAASGAASIATPSAASAIAWASASFRLKASTFVSEMRTRFVNVPFAQDDVTLVRIYELLRAFRYGGTRDALCEPQRAADAVLDLSDSIVRPGSFRRQRSVRSRRTNSVTSVGSAASAAWQKVVSVGSNSDCDQELENENDNETVVIDDAANDELAPRADTNVFDAYRDEVRTFLQLFAPLLTAERSGSDSSSKHAFADVYCVALGSASASPSARKLHLSPSLAFYSTNAYIRTVAERAHDENSDCTSLRRTAADLERLLSDLDQKLTVESRGVRRTEALLRKTLEGDGFTAAAQRVGVDDLARLVRQFGSERDAQQCANLRTSQLRLAVSELQRAAFELQYAELLALTESELTTVLHLLGTSNCTLKDHLQLVQPRGQQQLLLHSDTARSPPNTETERRTAASTFCCTVKRAVAASPNGLLALLFARGALLHGFVGSFFYTCRVYFDWLSLFTALCRLLRRAVDRFSVSDASAQDSWLFFRVAHRTVLLLRCWITTCAYDGVDLDFSKLDMDDANVSSTLTAALCDLRNAARPGEFAEPVRAIVAHLVDATTLNGLFCDAVHSLIVAQSDSDAVDASVSKSHSDSSYSSSNVSRTNSCYGPQRFDLDRLVATAGCSSYRVLREQRLSEPRLFSLITAALLDREREARRTGPSSYIRELNDDLLDLVRKRDRPLTVQLDKGAVATCLSRLGRPASVDSPEGPPLFSRMQVEDFSLLDHDSRLVTLALTRAAERLLSVLHPADFATLAVKNATVTRGSARVQAVREHEQRIACWVPFEFMSCLNERRRAKLLKRFVRVAADCLAQRDLLTAFALLHGLHDHHVRMSATLKSLPQKYSAMLTDLEAAKVRCECERDAMCFEPTRSANGDERAEACRVMPTLPNVSIFEKHLRQLLVGGLTAHNGMARLARLSPFAAQLDQVRLFNHFGYFDERPRGGIYLSLEVGAQSENLLRAVNDLGELLLSRLLFCSRQNLQNLATLASNSAMPKTTKPANGLQFGTLRGKKEPSAARNGSLMRTFQLTSTKLRK